MKVTCISQEAQIKVNYLLWRGQMGAQSLYFEHQSGLLGIQEIKSAGEFSVTLAISILALGIATGFWPIYLISGAVFCLSYYLLYRTHVETRNWEAKMTESIRRVVNSLDEAHVA